MRILTSSLVFGTVAAGCLFGQSVLSVNSGLVHYAEGKVYAADKIVEPKFGHFPQLNNNDELRTEEGRAEVLLSPGSFLRVAENSSIRMISNRITDTKIELLSGEALIEKVDEAKDKAAAMVKGNSLTLIYKGATISLVKSGVYVFNAEPGRVRVYDGEAVISSGGTQLTLKKGKETLLEGALMASKFDSKLGDELVRWSSRRSGYVAMANVSAARSLRDSSQGFSGSGFGFGMLNGGWAYNPWYGMYTYVPWNGFAYSPFGYSYWSPFNVYRFYAYAPSYYGGGLSYPGSRNVGTGGGTQAVAGIRSAPAFSHGLNGAAHSAPPSFERGGMGAGRISGSDGGMYRGGMSSGGGMSSSAGMGGGRMSGAGASIGSSSGASTASAPASHAGGAGRR